MHLFSQLLEASCIPWALSSIFKARNTAKFFSKNFSDLLCCFHEIIENAYVGLCPTPSVPGIDLRTPS